MKFLMLLAVKNLSRYRRRTLITATVIGVGLMLFLMIDSLLVGIDRESVRNLKQYETASLKVMHTEYWEDRILMPLDVSIPQPYDLVTELHDAGYRATPRTRFSADLILYSEDFGEDGNIPIQVTAIDTALDSTVFDLEQSLMTGRYPEMGSNEMVIGSWMAEDINAEVGYWVTLVTRGNGGFFEAMDMKIVGIVNCPNPNVNRSLLLVPIDTVSDYLAMEGLATEIAIALPDSADISHEKELIGTLMAASGAPLTVLSWDEMASDYIAMIEAETGSSSVILFLVFLIAAVGISNTMIMAINERVRELGMMRALGMSDRKIHRLYILETAAN